MPALKFFHEFCYIINKSYLHGKRENHGKAHFMIKLLHFYTATLKKVMASFIKAKNIPLDLEIFSRRNNEKIQKRIKFRN